MKKNNLVLLLKQAAIAGNILFILWVSYNAIKEGFSGTLPEKVSGAGLVGLLIVNCFLLINYTFKNQTTNQQ